MTIEEAIGTNVKSRREALSLTQKQLGERLGDHLGRAWSRQAVSSAEQGGRDFRAAELVALAKVLETSVGRLVGAGQSVVTADQEAFDGGYQAALRDVAEYVDSLEVRR